MKRAHRRGGAFTLVELVIVIAIMGILAAVAVPRFSGATERYRVQVAADRIARDIDLARARALATGTQQTIAFTPGTLTYTIVGMASPDHNGGSYVVALGREPYTLRRLGADFNSSTSLVFNGFAVPASAGTVTVESRSYSCRVLVAAGTGVCEIERPTGVTPAD